MGHAERRAALASDDRRFLLQVVTGKSPTDPGVNLIPVDPIPVSLRDVAQYAWLAAIPAPYAGRIMRGAVKGMSSAQNSLTDRLNQLPASARERLSTLYGSHVSFPLPPASGCRRFTEATSARKR